MYKQACDDKEKEITNLIDRKQKVWASTSELMNRKINMSSSLAKENGTKQNQ